MELALGLLAVALLILANGWFVLGEFAYVAADRSRLVAAADAGDYRAAGAIEVQRRLSFMLSGAQLGITATSLLVGAVAEPLFRTLLAPALEAIALPRTTSTAVAVTAGLLLSTGVQMVFGELAPKNLGIARAETFSRWLASGMRAYLWLAGPVIRVFDSAANGLLRAFGVQPAEELEASADPSELAFIIDESEHAGALSNAQAELLERALAFRQLRAAEVMVPRPQVVAVEASATCEELRRAAATSGHSRFPVVGDGLDDVVGVVRATQVLCVPVAARAARTVGEICTEAVVVPETARLVAVLTELRRSRSPLAVVVDEHGATAGLVTLEDVVEELVGEIREADEDEPTVVARPGGAFLVPGSWRPDEVARDTGISLPEGSYETVSGLVMEQLGRLPEPGDLIEIDGVTLRVVRTEGHAVGRVWMTGPR